MTKHSKKIPRSHQSGMTLIELMITTIILAILATTAVPVMKSLFERKSVFAIGDMFVKSIKLARLEAIQRGKTVRVKTVSGTGDWAQGWFIEFTDDGGNIQTIRTFPPLPSLPNFTSGQFNAGSDLTILPTGQVLSVGSFDLYYSNCAGNQRLGYNILLSGLLQKGVSACP